MKLIRLVWGLLPLGTMCLSAFVCAASLSAQTGTGPSPMLDAHTKVDWWFAFKFNTTTFHDSCPTAQRACPFGGTVKTYSKGFCQEFAIASSIDHTLKSGGPCIGNTKDDPLGASFNQIYFGDFSYVIWNDQFHGDPIGDRDDPWGHSKGILAWNHDGDGLVLQVSTPEWPGSGSSTFPRGPGNSLGCLAVNNVLVSQHFFALKLTKADVVVVLGAMVRAQVPTNASVGQIVRVKNDDPADIKAQVGLLGTKSTVKRVGKDSLSSGVVLISKPPLLHVPPWQLVSEELDAEPLRVASWWINPDKIPNTKSTTKMGCWDLSLNKPGAVQNASTGTWNGQSIALRGGPSASGNHAKIGVSTGSHTYTIFGDMNQQGSIQKTNCDIKQNIRGGMFFVVDDAPLFNSVRDLLAGQ